MINVMGGMDTAKGLLFLGCRARLRVETECRDSTLVCARLVKILERPTGQQFAPFQGLLESAIAVGYVFQFSGRSRDGLEDHAELQHRGLWKEPAYSPSAWVANPDLVKSELFY